MQIEPTMKRILDHGGKELRALSKALVAKDVDSAFTAERFAHMILDAITQKRFADEHGTDS